MCMHTVDNALLDSELAQLHLLLDSTGFPWYYSPDDVAVGTGSPFLSHGIVLKDTQGQPVAGTVNSEVYPLFEGIFHRLFGHRVMLRCSLNRTFHTGRAWGTPHVDHEFDHHNAIVYLSHAQGGTALFDHTGCITDQSTPAYNRMVQFDGVTHAQGSCAPGETRTVLVYTYL
jgi:hypothetical protein